MAPTAADCTREWHCNACLVARPQKRDAPTCACGCRLCMLAKQIESGQQRADRAKQLWVKAVNGGMR